VPEDSSSSPAIHSPTVAEPTASTTGPAESSRPGEGRVHIPAGVALAPPRFDHDLDVEGIIAQVPDTALIKGFFVNNTAKMIIGQRPDLAEQVRAQLARPRYHAFSSYPRGEVMRFEVEIARLLCPGLPDREALRRTTHRVYPLFLSSLLGRVVLGTLGRDVDSVLRLGPRMFSAVTSFGTVEVERVRERHWLYHYKDYYSWLDCGDLGVLEGLLMHYGMTPTMRLAMNGPFEMWLELKWDEAPR
jgi:uncharacterized protein (TIGR02265 family)